MRFFNAESADPPKGVNPEALVADMTFQPDIQERICKELEKGLSYSVGLLSGETMARLAEAVGVETRDRCYMPKEVARAMLRPERTLTARVAELERVQAEHARDIERLKKATGLK
jgi:hypothetical protein